MSSILFEPPRSRFDPSFWEELYKKKLNDYKLSKVVNEEIESFYELNDNFLYAGNTLFSKNSFSNESSSSSSHSCLIVYNSPDDFKSLSKITLIKNYLTHYYIKNFFDLKDSIEDSHFLRFSYLLSCPDLKKYKFTFW